MKRKHGNRVILSALCLALLSACSGGGEGGAIQDTGTEASFGTGLDLGGKLPPAPGAETPPLPSEAPEEHSGSVEHAAPVAQVPGTVAALCVSSCHHEAKQCVVSGLGENALDAQGTADAWVASVCADKGMQCVDQCDAGPLTCADAKEARRVAFNEYCHVMAAGDANKLIACAIGYKVQLDAFAKSCMAAKVVQEMKK